MFKRKKITQEDIEDYIKKLLTRKTAYLYEELQEVEDKIVEIKGSVNSLEKFNEQQASLNQFNARRFKALEGLLVQCPLCDNYDLEQNLESVHLPLMLGTKAFSPGECMISSAHADCLRKAGAKRCKCGTWILKQGKHCLTKIKEGE